MILIVFCSKENRNGKRDAKMIIPTNNESSSQSPVKIIPVCFFYPIVHPYSGQSQGSIFTSGSSLFCKLSCILVVPSYLPCRFGIILLLYFSSIKRISVFLKMLNNSFSTYSKIKMPRCIRLKLWKSFSGTMRHHFNTWIGPVTFSPLRIIGVCWIRLYAVAKN